MHDGGPVISLSAGVRRLTPLFDRVRHPGALHGCLSLGLLRLERSLGLGRLLPLLPLPLLPLDLLLALLLLLLLALLGLLVLLVLVVLLLGQGGHGRQRSALHDVSNAFIEVLHAILELLGVVLVPLNVVIQEVSDVSKIVGLKLLVVKQPQQALQLLYVLSVARDVLLHFQLAAGLLLLLRARRLKLRVQLIDLTVQLVDG
mmetsp:Transcript_12267/g.34144  ORF Transcript_12267/g.34144 Transcript_12267/m.34144 type:complete len:202 (-) Transcript_12267:398-1003(-)